MGKTAIAWTEETWNPVTGCSKVSPGCAHCYAETLTKRYAGQPGWPVEFKPWTPENAAENVVLHPDRLDMPLRWRKPKMVFVNSMSDLFHELVPDDFIAQVFARMLLTPQHTYQVLTKRSERMREWCSDPLNMNWVRNKAAALLKHPWEKSELLNRYFRGPLPNVWLGVSAENQRWADARLPDLLATDAAVRFVSAEPLLGPIDFGSPGDPDLTRYLWLEGYGGDQADGLKRGLDWVIVGGESGPHHRPMEVDWARSIRDQCVGAGVPFFFKQYGGATPKTGGRLLDGREWNEYPEVKREYA